MLSASSFTTVALLAASGGVVGGCCEECRPDVNFRLPLMGPSNVEVALARTRGGTPAVTCTVSDSASVDAGIESLTWKCEPPPKSSTGELFTYQFDHPANPWFASFKGPSEAHEDRLSADSNDPGEGWPGGCPCYGFEVIISASSLLAVSK